MTREWPGVAIVRCRDGRSSNLRRTDSADRANVRSYSCESIGTGRCGVLVAGAESVRNARNSGYDTGWPSSSRFGGSPDAGGAADAGVSTACLAVAVGCVGRVLSALAVSSRAVLVTGAFAFEATGAWLAGGDFLLGSLVPGFGPPAALAAPLFLRRAAAARAAFTRRCCVSA